MTTHQSPEGLKLLKLIDQAPFSIEEKAKWHDSLDTNGILEETIDEIHKSLTELPAEKFANDWQRAKLNMDFAVVSRQWRLSQSSKKFKHNR